MLGRVRSDERPLLGCLFSLSPDLSFVNVISPDDTSDRIVGSYSTSPVGKGPVWSGGLPGEG